jgi:hypothetical protein
LEPLNVEEETGWWRSTTLEGGNPLEDWQQTWEVEFSEVSIRE